MRIQDYVMLTLYEYIQVRNDFANMIVITKQKYKNFKEKEKHNFYIINKNEFHFYQFKTIFFSIYRLSKQ